MDNRLVGEYRGTKMKSQLTWLHWGSFVGSLLTIVLSSVSSPAVQSREVFLALDKEHHPSHRHHPLRLPLLQNLLWLRVTSTMDVDSGDNGIGYI